MPTLEGIDPTLQTIGTFLFVAVVAIFSGWSLVFGRKPAKSETKEFSMAAQLADMGPVRELVQQAGLLVQQQVRTNIALDRMATLLAEDLDARRKAESERDLEEEIDRRARIAAEDIVRQREDEAAGRRQPRKTT